MDTIAMFLNVLVYGVTGLKRSCKHYPHFALYQNIGRPVSYSGFRTCIGQTLKTESSFIKVGSLLGIAYVKLNKIGSFKRKKIGNGFRLKLTSGLHSWFAKLKFMNGLMQMKSVYLHFLFQ